MQKILWIYLLLWALLSATPVYADNFQKGAVAYEAGDFANALQKWRPLAEQGDISVQYILGLMYYNGKGTKQDYQEALKWFQQAAGQGDAKAQYSLGVMYYQGQGTKQDYKEALKWYLKAAKQGHREAQLSLSRAYAEGSSGKQDIQEAIKWLKLAAGQKVPSELDAIKKDSAILIRQDDGKEKLERLRQAAKQGDAKAQFYLGVMYDKGEETKQDYHQAFKWYQQAAKQGHIDAQYNLGVMYKKGQGTEQDYIEALKWYLQATKQTIEYYEQTIEQEGKIDKQRSDVIKESEENQRSDDLLGETIIMVIAVITGVMILIIGLMFGW